MSKRTKSASNMAGMKSEAIDNRVDALKAAGIDTSPLPALAHGLLDVLRYHQLMGIETYPLSSSLKQVLQPITRQAVVDRIDADASVQAARVLPEASRILDKGEASVRLNLLQEEIKACRRCALSGACQGIVPGSGQVGVSLLVLGDYSLQEGEFCGTTLFGVEEDTMLWNMMRAIGLTPAEVYVTNVVKCCPRLAAQPAEEDIRCCREHLLREIEMVQPKVLCAMGEMAAHALVDSQISSFRLRGTFHPYRENRALQVMVTLHPRLLLKNATMKKAVWQDLQQIQRLLQAM
jgi:uracil-DNA glycosylase